MIITHLVELKNQIDLLFPLNIKDGVVIQFSEPADDLTFLRKVTYIKAEKDFYIGTIESQLFRKMYLKTPSQITKVV